MKNHKIIKRIIGILVVCTVLAGVFFTGYILLLKSAFENYSIDDWYERICFVTDDERYKVSVWGNDTGLHHPSLQLRFIITDTAYNKQVEINQPFHYLFSDKNNIPLFEFETINENKAKLILNETREQSEIIFVWADIFDEN